MSRVGAGVSRGVGTTGHRAPPLVKIEGPRAKAQRDPVIPARIVETLEPMSASKFPAPEAAQKLGPLAARSPALRGDHGTPVLVQEKVIAEITHELGNFFHKLYYWSDFLKEKPAHKAAESTAAQMLERTIKNLEDFLKVSLGYFHPTQMSFTRMAVSDLVEGLLFQVRSHLNAPSVTVSESGSWRTAGGEVLVDPGHLSYAFEVAVRHLTKQMGPESSITVVIEQTARREGPALEIGFLLRQPNEASPLFRTAEAGIEWAVAQKFVTLHGGELLERSEEAGEKQFLLFIPLCL
jgi:signal transduction histidine kinase